MIVNIFDENFAHTEKLLGYITSSDTRKPSKIEWVSKRFVFDGVTVFTDFYCDSQAIDQVQSKYKMFWLVEPKVIHPWAYEWIIKNQNKFDCVLTYDVEFAKKNLNNYKIARFGSSRIDNYDNREKTKLLSMIASDKTITEGHRLRHKIANIEGIDLWGSGYKRFESKMDPLADYCFSICIQNCKINYYYTEILIDAFRTKTVPIFWGCPDIGLDFDKKGILEFDSIEDLKEIIKSLSFEKYKEMVDSVENNYKISEMYLSTDDLLVNSISDWVTQRELYQSYPIL